MIAAVAYGLNYRNYARIYDAHERNDIDGMCALCVDASANEAMGDGTAEGLFGVFRNAIVLDLRRQMVEEILKLPGIYGDILDMENVNESNEREEEGDNATRLAEAHRRGGRPEFAKKAYQEAHDRYAAALQRVDTSTDNNAKDKLLDKLEKVRTRL